MLTYSKRNQKSMEPNTLNIEGIQKSTLISTKSEGIPQPMRERFEGRYGFDLSNVEVHLGAPEHFGSIAYTQGSDIYMSKSAESIKDRVLLHELMHVVQQAQGRVEPDFGMLNLDPMMELSADSGAREAMNFAGGSGALAPMPSFSSAAPVQFFKNWFTERRKNQREEEENRFLNSHDYNQKLQQLKLLYSLAPNQIEGLQGNEQNFERTHGDNLETTINIADKFTTLTSPAADLGAKSADVANKFSSVMNVVSDSKLASNILYGVSGGAAIVGGIMGMGTGIKDIVDNGKEADNLERTYMGVNLLSSATSIASGATGIAAAAGCAGASMAIPGLSMLSGAIDVVSGGIGAHIQGKKQKALEELGLKVDLPEEYERDKGIAEQTNQAVKEEARLRNMAIYTGYQAQGKKASNVANAISGGFGIGSGIASVFAATGVGAAAALGLAATSGIAKLIGWGVKGHYDKKARRTALQNMEGTEGLSAKELKIHNRVMEKQTGMNEKDRFYAMIIKDAMHLYDTGTVDAQQGNQMEDNKSMELLKALGVSTEKEKVTPQKIAESMGLPSGKWKSMMKKYGQDRDNNEIVQ